jgi:nucleoside-diphosphate-sugar epimerase
VNKIIVLGHTGFIGNSIFLTLQKKYSKNKTIQIKGLSSKQANLLNKSAIKKLKKEITTNSIIIICSAIKSNYGNNLELFNKNLSMIKNIAYSIKEKKIKKIIYLSSNAVYGVKRNCKLANEKTQINTDTFYGLSKYISEQTLKLVLGRKNEKKLIIIRPTIAYGPNEKLIAGSPSGFIKLIKGKKNFFIWGKGNEIRDFLYIEDLTTILIKLISKNFYGILNVSGFSSSYLHLIRKISKILKIKPKITYRKRTTPKVDKTYSKKLLKKIFPKIKLTSIESGISKILKQEFS